MFIKNSINSDGDLYSRFKQQVISNPDKTALRYDNTSLSYAELDNLSARIAQFILKNLPIPAGTGNIIIAMSRNPLTIASIIATQRLNLTYVPFDPESPDERLHYIIQDCQPSLVLTTREWRKRQSDCPEIYIEDLDNDNNLVSVMPQPIGDDAIAYIMYTSGSTGQPKGVLIPQRGISRLVVNAHPFQFSSTAIISQCGNIAFDASTLEIWGALLNGATLVIIPYDIVIDSQALAELLQREAITDAFFTVALFNQLVAENPNVFAGLNNVLTGGDALNPASVLTALSAQRPPKAIWNAYGPTENTVITTLHRIQRSDCLRSSIPLGRSISGSQCYVLDAHMQAVSEGEEGELYTSGLGLAHGYLNKPDKTSETFLPNPFYEQECETSPASASPVIYRTGDRVRLLADGKIDFLGRMDNQVKIRGFRLEPGEVEHRLCQLPGVELAVVQPIMVDGQKQLAAWCQGSGTPQQVLAQFREQAPAYMIPVSLQWLDKLPITANGKVNKALLPVPEINNHEYEPVQTATEGWLEQIWQDLLGLEKAPGRKGHFFWSGGHSLLLVKLRQAISRNSGKDVSLAELFRFPVLHEMADYIETLPDRHCESQIPAVPPGSRVPLSEEQNRLWITCCRDPQVAHYSIPLAFRVQGSLDIDRLTVALRKLSERHHALRLRIVEEQGTAWQQVVDEPLSLTTVQVSTEKDISAHINEDVLRPFCFGDEPLLRVTLFCVEKQPCVLLINIHHIITDGWSMGVFFQELAALYNDDAPLQALPCQYTDYCALQQQTDELRMAWWENTLKDVTPLALPVSGTPLSGSVVRHKVLPSKVMNDIQKTAFECQTGLFNLMYSGLSLLLSRLCQQQDVAISGIWANRPHPDLSDLIGFFANTLILRTQVEPQKALGAWLASNHQMLTQSFEYGDVSLSRVLAATNIPSTPVQHPLCAVLLVLQNTQGGDGKCLKLDGCEFNDYPLPEEHAKSDLLINIVPQDDGKLRLEATFRKGVWPEVLQESLLDLYQAILEKMTEGLQQSLSGIVGLNEAMRHKQLVEWNSPPRMLPEQTLLARFAHWVQQTPDKIAVRCQSHTLTYAQLDQRANQISTGLQVRRGSLKGKRVAFVFERQIDSVTMILAILKAGASYVPFDPAHPNERLHYVLTDSEADCVVVDADTSGRQTVCPEIVLDSLKCETFSFMPVIDRGVHDEVYIMYTSGSTGEPKGVKVLQQGILRLVVGASPYTISADAIVAQAGNIAFDASTLEIWGPLLNGAQIEVIPYETVINSAELQQVFSERGITDAWFTVALFNQLAADNPGAFAGLKNLLIGGDALTPSLVDAVLNSDTPPAQIWNGYGPTENTTFTTLHPIQRKDCSEPSIPIGASIGGTTCYVLDGEKNLLPPGAIGELYTSGDGLANGYLNKAEKTAEVFIKNPFFAESHQQTAATEMMYRTGDRVRWKREGVLEFIGRTDNQVKIRGYRLEPGEVEFLLCQVDGVKQALVRVVEHQGQKQLAAWCVSDRLSADIIADFSAQVPAYMVPSALQAMDKFPLTANGKIDQSRLPPADFMAGAVDGMPPQGETEQQLARIWQQLLNTDRPCQREDNFFMIGGHSLLVIKMTDQIQAQMAKSVSVATVFRCRSLAELAANIDGEDDGAASKESTLIAADIAPSDAVYPSADARNFNDILLTGASGFLGIHLLVELQRKRPQAIIHCLVRGTHGLQRLRDVAGFYQLALDEKRLRIINGDLDLPLLGMDSAAWEAIGESIDAIYHCGAWVNHLHTYPTLRDANVESTRQLLSLCRVGRAKHLFYISTLSAAATENNRILEQPLADAPPMANGYVQSKWVSEKLVSHALNNGLHGAIYRMGNIMGSVDNGISNVETNHTLNLIKGCLQLGVAPAWPHYQLDVSPVDRLANLLVDESLKGQFDQQAVNLGYLSAIPWKTLLSLIAGNNRQLRFVSADEWANEWVPKVNSDNALYPFKSFYLVAHEHPRIQIDHALVIQNTGTLDTEKLIRQYRQYWSECGFLELGSLITEEA